MRLNRNVAIAISTALVLVGCDYLPFGYTPIKDIVATPANFDSKEVKIKGKVSEAIKLPILGQAFILRDDTGEITVITRGTLPSADAEVALNGIVKSTAIVGGKSLGLRVEETKRLR
jgi:hypothetical protein